MKTQLLKYGALATMMAALMTGCSSTDTTGNNGDGWGNSGSGNDSSASSSSTTGGTGDSGVSTGGAGDGSLDTNTLAAGSTVPRVFYFEYDRAVLNAEARMALRKHANTLKNKPMKIRLEGHTDERGTREYNMALGERRAKAVRAFLMSQGVSSNLIEVISYGEESPAKFGSSAYAHSQNRRVELKN